MKNSSAIRGRSVRVRSAETNGREGLPRVRSAVTNGRRLFVESDARGPWGRRFRDVLAEVISDLGGHDGGLSEGQRQLARRVATISIACEQLEGQAASGTPIDLELYGRLTDRLGRAFQRLGLKRQQRQILPDPLDYAREVDAREQEQSTP